MLQVKYRYKTFYSSIIFVVVLETFETTNMSFTWLRLGQHSRYNRRAKFLMTFLVSSLIFLFLRITYFGTY